MSLAPQQIPMHRLCKMYGMGQSSIFRNLNRLKEAAANDNEPMIQIAANDPGSIEPEESAGNNGLICERNLENDV